MIDWIDVKQRVPDNRRSVLVWGVGGFWLAGCGRNIFLGDTKFNATRDGGRFDVENSRPFTFCSVTHWAEIDGPDGSQIEPQQLLRKIRNAGFESGA